MGDTNVVYIYQLPYSFAGINLATSTQLILPTGDKDLLLSDNSLGGQVSLIAQKTYRSWEAVANTGYRYTDGAQTQNLKQYNRLISSVGLNYYVNDKFSFGPEYYQEYTLDKGENNFLKFTSMNSHYAVTKNSKLFASVGSGNLRDFTNDHFRFLVGIKISAQNESPAPVPLNIQMVEKEDEVHSVYFAWNSSKLNNKFKAKLRKLSRNLKPNQKIRLSGQADQSGKSDYNTLLSKRRALAVKNYLDELGVTNRIIETSALVDGQSHKVDIIVE